MRVLIALTLVLGACASPASEGTPTIDDLPPVTAAEFEAHLSELDRPAVVNVWASWCLPCRSEAPLLNEAFAQFGSDVEFIGIDVQDTQVEAKEFLAEFGLDFDHFFDRDRSIPNAYSGIGTPITMFFGPGGDLVTIHNGVIDERTLALNIDEILLRDG